MNNENKLQFIEAMLNWFASPSMGRELDVKFLSDAYDDITSPAWVSVEERLPEKENEFEDYSKLVVVTNGKDFWKGMYNYGREEWRTFDLWWIDDATHWMEIVLPVKKGGEQ